MPRLANVWTSLAHETNYLNDPLEHEIRCVRYVMISELRLF